MIPVAAGYGIARFSSQNPLMPIKLNKKRIAEILEGQVAEETQTDVRANSEKIMRKWVKNFTD